MQLETVRLRYQERLKEEKTKKFLPLFFAATRISQVTQS